MEEHVRQAGPESDWRHPTATSAGWRVLPQDRLTVAGPIDTERRVYVVATHSGVTLAPLLRRLVRSELVDGTNEPMLGPFRPERFAAGTSVFAQAQLIRRVGEQ